MATTVYLNTASCGLIAPVDLEAGNKLYADFAYNSSRYSEQWAMQDEARIRQTVASFIGANVRNTALVPNFSWALNAVVQSLSGHERVLLYKGDFPSLIQPFAINNFPITWVDDVDGFNIDIEAIREAITSKSIDIVALSHVQWGTGYKADLKTIGDLCREHGVWFIIDATQSLGANELDLSTLNIDVLAASHYKWMNAGFGTGILYVSDRFLKQNPPVVGGFHTDRVRHTDETAPTAASYEPGSPNMAGLLLLEAAIAAKNRIGLGEIQRHNGHLTQLFLSGISDLPIKILGDHTMTNRCSIVLLHDQDGLGQWLEQHNITVTHRNGMLRVSMHFYNTEDDVNALVKCLRTKFA